MKQLAFICFLLSSCVSFSQEFGQKEKEELIFRSLQSSHAATTGKRYLTMYVLVDSMDEHVQNFIKEKFPKKKWVFFDQKGCQSVLKNITRDYNSDVLGFELMMWEYKGTHYLSLQVCMFSRYWSADQNEVQATVFCPDDPLGTLRYNKEKARWIFNSYEDYRKERLKTTTEPDHNHCPPTDDSVQSF